MILGKDTNWCKFCKFWLTVYQCWTVREFEANNKTLEHFLIPFQVLTTTSIHSANSKRKVTYGWPKIKWCEKKMLQQFFLSDK